MRPRNWSVPNTNRRVQSCRTSWPRLSSDSGLTPPSPEEMALALGVDLREMADALKMLLGRGEVVRVGRTFFFSRLAIDDLRERLRAFLIARGAISTQEMKALAGGSRKVRHSPGRVLRCRKADASSRGRSSTPRPADPASA